MPSVNCCSMCCLNVSILGTLQSPFLCHFLRQYKYGFARPQQGVQGDCIWGNLILSCCAHKSNFRQKKGILILSCCAHKSDFRHNLCIVIFVFHGHKFHSHHNLYIVILSCCAHKSDFRHNLCILIFVFRVYTWFTVLIFCSFPNTLRNTLLIDQFFFWILKIKSVCILCTVFSPFS